jgi:hypothetical protein
MTVEIAGGGKSAAGRPRLSIRLMASLLYLKHTYNLSDEDVVERWAENVAARVKVVVASVMQPTVEYGYPPNASL